MLILVSECNVCNMESPKIEQINLCLELKDYRIYYVNMHLHHQYGIFIAESQRFLWAKRPKRWEARRNGRFRRLIPCRLISYTQQLEILAKALPHVNNFPVCIRKHFQNQIFV